MKKLPKSFLVFGQKIKITNKLPMAYAKMYDEQNYNLWGLYLPHETTVYVNPKQSMEMQWRTLYHELGHALMYRIGLPYSEEFGAGLHEQIVETYANFIFESFHKSNK
jgi:Zn-dependent peptidase ImmA (M78 family)